MAPYYERDGITIYHADCREVLPTVQADLLCTDPPYGIGVARAKWGGGKGRTHRVRRGGRVSRVALGDYGDMDWDDHAPPPWIFGQMMERTRHQIIFGGNYFALPRASCWLVWDKLNGLNHYADCELAWTSLPKAVRRIAWRWNGFMQQDMARKEPRLHRAQKPEPVMRWCILNAPDDSATILDPYAGSGTTLLAARNLGRRAIGIEREEKFCEMAAKRLETELLVRPVPRIPGKA